MVHYCAASSIVRHVECLPNLVKDILDDATDCAASCAPDHGALVFVEYEVTYRIHYRTGIRSMHAKAEKQAQLEPATQGERADRRTGG